MIQHDRAHLLEPVGDPVAAGVLARAQDMISPVEVFVFDLGGVIASHDTDFWYCRLASRCDCDSDDSRLRSALHDTRYSTGQASIAELHKHLVTTLDYDGPWEEFLLDWSCHFDIDQEMIKLLAWLARDRRVIIFSNTNREHREYLVHASGGALANVRQVARYANVRSRRAAGRQRSTLS
jgi:FMN phosphatase YigB (HAD superfamily)